MGSDYLSRYEPALDCCCVHSYVVVVLDKLRIQSHFVLLKKKTWFDIVLFFSLRGNLCYEID